RLARRAWRLPVPEAPRRRGRVMAVQPRTTRRVREASPHRGEDRPLVGPLLLDTNVLLDALLERAEWAHEAAVLLAAAERGDVKAVVSVHALTTLDYVARRAVGGVRSRNAVAQLLTFVQVVGPDTDDVKYALSLAIPDFE